jgi:hypothetical protein
MKSQNNFLIQSSLLLGMSTFGTLLMPLVVSAQPSETIENTPNLNDSNTVDPRNTGSLPQLPTKSSSQVVIKPVNGYVNVTLTNTTNTPVRYQVVGDTALRTLSNSSTTNLQNLQTPVDISFYREDGGKLFATPKTSTTPGVLDVNLTEAMNTESYHSSLTVEPTGAIDLK